MQPDEQCLQWLAYVPIEKLCDNLVPEAALMICYSRGNGLIRLEEDAELIYYYRAGEGQEGRRREYT